MLMALLLVHKDKYEPSIKLSTAGNKITQLQVKTQYNKYVIRQFECGTEEINSDDYYSKFIK